MGCGAMWYHQWPLTHSLTIDVFVVAVVGITIAENVRDRGVELQFFLMSVSVRWYPTACVAAIFKVKFLNNMPTPPPVCLSVVG